jgi:hypothetical protein
MSTTPPIDYDALARQASTIPQTPAAPSYSTDDVQRMVSEAAKKYGVDEGLALKLAKTENGYKPSGTSTKGALGPMQLMPDTATELGVDPLDPKQNIDGGVRYLGQLIKRYDGDHSKAVAAYNFGMGNLESGKPLPAETRNYVKAITGKDFGASANVDYDALAKKAIDYDALAEANTEPGAKSQPPAPPKGLELPGAFKPGDELPETFDGDDDAPDSIGYWDSKEQAQLAAEYNRQLDAWKNQAQSGASTSPAAAPSAADKAPSKATLEMMGRNVQTLVDYAKRQREGLDQERIRLGIAEAPLDQHGRQVLGQMGVSPSGGANQQDVDAFNAKLGEHDALVNKIQASIDSYKTQVDAYNREQTQAAELHNLPIRQAQITAAHPGAKAPLPEGLNPDALKFTGINAKTGLAEYEHPGTGDGLADALRVLRSSPIPAIPIASTDYSTPVFIPNFGPIPVSVVKSIANTITGQVNPETAAIMVASAGLGEMFAAAANSAKAAELLKNAPALAKIADIASRTAVPAGFGVYQGAEAGSAGLEFAKLRKEAAELRAQGEDAKAEELEHKAQDHAVAAVTNLVMGAASMAGAVKTGLDVNATYPAAASESATIDTPYGGKISAGDVGGLKAAASPAEAAAAAEQLRAGGSRLAAQAWERLDSTRPTPITVNGKEAYITPVRRIPGSRISGRPNFYMEIVDGDGNTLVAGSPDSVRSWLQVNQADIPLMAGDVPLREEDLQPSATVLRQPTAISSGAADAVPTDADPFFAEKLDYLRSERNKRKLPRNAPFSTKRFAPTLPIR